MNEPTTEQLRAELERVTKERKFETERIMNAVPVDMCITFRGNVAQYVDAAISKQQQELERVKQQLDAAKRDAEFWKAEYETGLAVVDGKWKQLDAANAAFESAADKLHLLRQELDAANRREAANKALHEQMRDCVLNQRNQLEGYRVDNDIINAVLDIIDEHTLKAALQPDAGSTGERLFTESEVRPLVDALNAIVQIGASIPDNTKELEIAVDALVRANELGL